ncbi:unnamed protein product, partial [Prorocentrum cordatum]
MSAFARCGDYAGTYKVFMRMLEDGARPNLMHYTAMLTSCARDGDGTTADGVFASMLAAGVQPDVPAYTYDTGQLPQAPRSAPKRGRGPTHPFGPPPDSPMPCGRAAGSGSEAPLVRGAAALEAAAPAGSPGGGGRGPPRRARGGPALRPGRRGLEELLLLLLLLL